MILKIISAILFLTVFIIIIWAIYREFKKRKVKKINLKVSDQPVLNQPVSKPSVFKSYACEIKSFEIVQSDKPEEFICMLYDPVVIIRDNRRLNPGERTVISTNIRINSNVWFTRKGYNNVFAPPPPGYHKEYWVLDRDFAYKYVKNV